MKIILTIKELTVPGGAERSFVGLANNLNKRGHSVTVVVYDRKTQSIKRTFYTLDANIRIENLYKRDLYYFLFKIEKFFVKLCSVVSSKIVSENSYYLFKRALRQRSYRRFIINHNPDLVISFLPNTYVDVFLALRNTSFPFVISHRNDPAKDFTLIACENEFEKKLRYDAVKYATVNTVLFDEYKAFFPESLQRLFCVVPNPALSTKKENIAKHDQAKDSYTILSVGRLTDIKNHQLLIKSFAILARKHINWQIKIFGSGPNQACLEDLIHTLNLSDRIHFMGVKQSIFEEYSKADIFALPSLFEGFPRALSEAMAHGLPSVVLEKCTGCRNLILKSAGGYVTKDDPEDYALKLEKLMYNPHKRKMIGLDARNYIMTTYTPDIVYGLWEKLIERIAENENTDFCAIRKKIATCI